MEQLSQIKVGTSYIPVFRDETLDGLFGCFENFPTQRILIKGQSQHQEDMTVLHELLHAVSDMYGLRLSESQVRVLEQVLTQLVADNYPLVAAWCSRIASCPTSTSET